MEGNNDKTDKNVDHEEGNDDKVYKVIEEYIWTIVLLWANVSLVGVNGDVENSAIINIKLGPIFSKFHRFFISFNYF